MKYFCTALCCVFIAAFSFAKEPMFKKVVLSKQFYAEGSSSGDFNKDGIPDVVAGPFWYQGPDFTKKHEIYKAGAANPEQYSDCFGMFTADLNGDGWDDIFVCPHPGTKSYWLENPKGKAEYWKKHFALDQLGNESPQWTEVVRGLGKGPIYNMNGKFGFGTFQVKEQSTDWLFHQISTDEKRYQRYTHGIGAGDVNGDGRTDMLESAGWWEQPADTAKTPWTFHPFKFAEAASHILVFDVDGDGKNDVVCSWHCHLYGLVWYKQIQKNGIISFEQHEILPLKPQSTSNTATAQRDGGSSEGETKRLTGSGVSFSQMHALAAADFNGDGLTDFVTGKRFWAHGSKGDVEANNPAVLYWFELKRGSKGSAEFIPHKIDDDSGVGTQVSTADLNGDNVPDIIVSNKKGTFVFLSE